MRRGPFRSAIVVVEANLVVTIATSSGLLLAALVLDILVEWLLELVVEPVGW